MVVQRIVGNDGSVTVDPWPFINRPYLFSGADIIVGYEEALEVFDAQGRGR